MDFILCLKNNESAQEIYQPHLFFEFLTKSENKTIKIKLFNILTENQREIEVIPNKKWLNSDGLLGIVLRYESFGNAIENVFKILNVFENSPADIAGLTQDDYVLGFPYYKYQNFNKFIDILANCNEKFIGLKNN